MLVVACSPATPASAPEPEEPVAETATSVLLVGDSVMDELAGPLTAAIEANGVDRATFALLPTLPHTPGDTAVWRATLDEAAPDVVVLHVGSWERLKVLGDFATGARVEPGTYRSEVVDPAVGLLHDSGARVLWLSPITVRNPDKAAFIESLADQWRDELPTDEFVDVRPAIAPHGFTARLPGIGQVRRADGIHLCPAGQALVAGAVLVRLAPLLTEPPPDDWAVAWRRTVDEPGGCRADYQPT